MLLDHLVCSKGQRSDWIKGDVFSVQITSSIIFVLV